MASMASLSVTSVHEDMQERTGEKEQERQIAKRVRAVLGHKQERGDQEESDRGKAGPRPPEAGRPRGAILRRTMPI